MVDDRILHAGHGAALRNIPSEAIEAAVVENASPCNASG